MIPSIRHRENDQQRIHCLTVAVAVLVAYLQALGADYLPIDDGIMLQAVQSGKISVPDLFLSGGREYYRPLATLSLLGDYLIFGGRVAGYHLGNILLHLANSLLVYALASHFFRREESGAFPAFLAALLFALHPVNSETVVWISCRPDLLCCLFCLLSLNILFRLERGSGFGAYIGMGLFFLCSLLAKEASLFILPAAAVRLFIARKSIGAETASKALSALALPVLAYLMLRKGMAPLLHTGPEGAAANDRAAVIAALDAVAAFGFYIRKLIYPFPLSFTITKIHTSLYIVASLIATTLAALFWKKGAELRTPVTFLAMSLGPPIGAMLALPIWTPYAERYLYIPSVFFVLCAAFSLSRFERTIPRFILVAAVLALTVPTALRVRLWTEPLPFWQKAVAQAPDFGTARLVLASELLKAGRYREADENLQLAVRLGLPKKSMESSLEIRRQLYEKLGNKAAASSL